MESHIMESLISIKFGVEVNKYILKVQNSWSIGEVLTLKENKSDTNEFNMPNFR